MRPNRGDVYVDWEMGTTYIIMRVMEPTPIAGGYIWWSANDYTFPGGGMNFEEWMWFARDNHLVFIGSCLDKWSHTDLHYNLDETWKDQLGDAVEIANGRKKLHGDDSDELLRRLQEEY